MKHQKLIKEAMEAFAPVVASHGANRACAAMLAVVTAKLEDEIGNDAMREFVTAAINTTRLQ
jgi:hypothetical protein